MRKFFYRVKEGDGVAELSAKYNAPIYSVIIDNALTSEPSAGDVLFIRGGEANYVVTPYDTEESVAEKFGITVEELKRKNGNLPYLFCGMRINA